MPATQTRPKKIEEHFINKSHKQQSLERKGVSSYAYAHQPQVEMSRYQRSSSREDNGSSPKSSGEEEEVKPVLTHSVPIEKRFKDVFKISDYSDEDRMMAMERTRVPMEEFKESYKRQPQKITKYTRAIQKADKQKPAEHRYRSVSPRRREEYRGGEQEDLEDRIYRAPAQAQVERTKSLKRYEQNFELDEDESPAPARYRNHSVEPPNRYRDPSPFDYRDSYKQQPESMPIQMPYREQSSQNNMIKQSSYKVYGGPGERFEQYQQQERQVPQNYYRGDVASRVIVHRADVVRHKQLDTPESTLTKASPRDRFQNAKEKFQAMERERLRKGQPPVADHQNKIIRPPNDRGGYQPNQYSGNWSSDEDIHMRANYRELPPNDRYPGLDRDFGGRMLPSKSLGNLVKGYRHSYAEPRFTETRQFSRNGRVGLAAVNPY